MVVIEIKQDTVFVQAPGFSWSDLWQNHDIKHYITYNTTTSIPSIHVVQILSRLIALKV